MAAPTDLPPTLAYFEQRERLKPEMREDFDALVQDYRYYAVVHHRQPFVSYKILATSSDRDGDPRLSESPRNDDNGTGALPRKY